MAKRALGWKAVAWFMLSPEPQFPYLYNEGVGLDDLQIPFDPDIVG